MGGSTAVGSGSFSAANGSRNGVAGCAIGDPGEAEPLTWWAFDAKKGKLELRHQERPPQQRLALHVFSVGIVRHITGEKPSRVFNEEHTPEEGDDETDRYVVTEYQYLRLPKRTVDLFQVVMESDPSGEQIDELIVWKRNAIQSAPPTFRPRDDSNRFIEALGQAAWRDGSPSASETYRQSASTDVLGIVVSAPGHLTAASARKRLATLYSMDDRQTITE